MTQRLPVGPALAAYSALAALLAPLVVIDARDQRLPTKPMIVAAATTTIMFIAFAAVDHEPGPLLRALASSGTCVLLLVITYLITSGFIGGGDIRLAALLVLALGWTGWSAAARSIMIGLIIGAMYSQYLRLRLRLGPLAHIPLGPALALGALSSILID
ncbi:prepilin peptidase [Actinokineospora globicatena]|uniref:prepilin peptidase n=1 Tax=Actinokineospora globicatena TaxID=103729 RepID=UPI0025573855|nr:prepilin peptidase [Actinokineospora globicatena]